MNALILIAVFVLFIALFMRARKSCEHEWQAPMRIDCGEWHEHVYEMPQLPGEKIKCMRRSATYSVVCRKCGMLKSEYGYDQKPHESDTMHKVSDGWEPEPLPGADNVVPFQRN